MRQRYENGDKLVITGPDNSRTLAEFREYKGLLSAEVIVGDKQKTRKVISVRSIQGRQKEAA